MATAEHRVLAHSGTWVFIRIVVGVDGAEPGFEACRQARALLEPDGWIELACALQLAETAAAGWSALRLADELEREGRHALCLGAEIAGPHTRIELLEGAAPHALLHEAEARHATLLALGTHGHTRLSEIVLGGTAGSALHEAPCSVLIARPAGSGTFPSRIVVGIDGSPEADRALLVAQALAGRFDASLRVVTALHGKGVDLGWIHLRMPFAEMVDAAPVDALVEAAEEADLLVVGSRGLHGMRALGSVSERVAHRAGCSVLVVRGRLDPPS
jgi:nucleotide-binding universal stress UspA family protein